jgi:putative transposase
MSVNCQSAPLIIELMNLLRLVRSAFDVPKDFASDVAEIVRLGLRSRTALIAENLFLRKQLAFYQEREIRPRRLTDAARLSLVLWSRFFDWKSALIVVKPATLIG